MSKTKLDSLQPLVDVRHLKQYFNINVGPFVSKPLKAVDDVSFSIRKGETLGRPLHSAPVSSHVGRRGV